MRLSEAIRLGAMMKPQAFHATFSNGGTCVFGAIYDACGGMDAAGNISEEWCAGGTAKHFPILPLLSKECPACREEVAWVDGGTLVHLNDHHRWTREQIADWVETLEVQQAAGAVDPVEGIAELTPVHARI